MFSFLVTQLKAIPPEPVEKQEPKPEPPAEKKEPKPEPPVEKKEPKPAQPAEEKDKELTDEEWAKENAVDLWLEHWIRTMKRIKPNVKLSEAEIAFLRAAIKNDDAGQVTNFVKSKIGPTNWEKFRALSKLFYEKLLEKKAKIFAGVVGGVVAGAGAAAAGFAFGLSIPFFIPLVVVAIVAGAVVGYFTWGKIQEWNQPEPIFVQKKWN